MKVDAAILTAVVAFLLPLRLLSLIIRLNSTGSAGDLRRSCAALAVAAALLAAIFALPRDHGGQARECAVSIAVPDDGEGGFRREVRSDIEQMKVQLARLESLWDNNSKALDGKGDASENGEVVRAMGLDIQTLINEQENIKESLCGSYSDNTIKAMEKEVQILTDELTKLNSDIHNIWSMAKDTDKRVQDLHSDVKMVQVLMDESKQMNYNVRELWSLAKDTERRVESLHSDIKKVQILIDESRKMESDMYKMWSFAKQMEKKVEEGEGAGGDGRKETIHGGKVETFGHRPEEEDAEEEEDLAATMDSEHWMSRLMAAKRQYALQRAQNHHATVVPHLDRYGYDDVEPEDETRLDFPCPYCYEDHNIASLCAHLEDEHPFESKVVACPVCSARISKDLLRRVAVPSNHALSLGGRDIQETYLKVLLGNSNRSSGTSAASSVTDSLLSSLVLSLSSPEAEDTAKSCASAVVENNWFKRAPPSKTWKASSDSNLSHEERERRRRQAAVRSSFVQHLLVSTLFDD
ncbi:hypothetical protein GUJ93_ZPchr0002g26727 [Zizania palustris]|uniref:Uncharacterized protein n=1 Tax=Zizania palustris TaxID=103762 RepID=A0A8J5SIM9_ZIZPA|nr:hypothetical protein GUJ93_ZPchr0002g26727 [Zizania palustris]